MSKGIYSPVLDYKMIMSKKELFCSLKCYEDSLYLYKKKSSGICDNCSSGYKNDFAQSIRNELVENKMIDIFKQLDPRTIVRYGRKIFRASDFT